MIVSPLWVQSMQRHGSNRKISSNSISCHRERGQIWETRQMDRNNNISAWYNANLGQIVQQIPVFVLFLQVILNFPFYLPTDAWHSAVCIESCLLFTFASLLIALILQCNDSSFTSFPRSQPVIDPTHSPSQFHWLRLSKLHSTKHNKRFVRDKVWRFLSLECCHSTFSFSLRSIINRQILSISLPTVNSSLWIPSPLISPTYHQDPH